MQQVDRPAQITTILKTIGSEYPADVTATLEAYISSLEANQLVLLLNDTPPIWSHMRVAERERQRRERALREQDNYR